MRDLHLSQDPQSRRETTTAETGAVVAVQRGRPWLSAAALIAEAHAGSGGGRCQRFLKGCRRHFRSVTVARKKLTSVRVTEAAREKGNLYNDTSVDPHWELCVRVCFTKWFRIREKENGYAYACSVICGFGTLCSYGNVNVNVVTRIQTRVWVGRML
ncbi:hypothetical protein E2542_SST22425 [Spatholobus suberectus]|nr:hypothetical protein E2542_SST22425 [Spatholobus suberectus]